MKTIDLGVAGQPLSADTPTWDDLRLARQWRQVIEVFAPASLPHDVQVKMLRECGLLQSRRNLIVSGPTNSGKSLLGYLAILVGLSEGRRALLIEPFRALAQEKHDELTLRLPQLQGLLRRVPQVSVTTGDYRINGETLMAVPPAVGEIVIATPERVEAIMRNPDFDSWVSSFGVVCVDEAHLIGDSRRGPSLESVITRFLCEKSPPRVVLISATLGSVGTVQEWLKPCDINVSAIRRPPLHQELVELEEGEKADDVVIERIGNALADLTASILVFVYRTEDAVKLASRINASLNNQTDKDVAAAYHAKMPAALKLSTRSAYETGGIRCLVSTTALGAGVNLPATHVIVRDLTFGRDGALPIRELLQMMGRAGRGARSGHATAILKIRDAWSQKDLVAQIGNPDLPELRSALLPVSVPGSQRSLADKAEGSPQIARIVLAQLVRRETQRAEDLHGFFDRSLGGREISGCVDDALRWLADSQRVLAWIDEESRIVATSLGKAVSRSGIPTEVGGGFGCLVRDLLSCDPSDALLGRWKPLDFLLVLELMSPRERGLRRFSSQLVDQVEDWMERSSQKSMLFADWIRGAAEASKADEVLGSLGMSLNGKVNAAESARQYAYQAMLRSIVITELGAGARIEDVSRRWDIVGLEGIQERWRDHLLWLMAGLSEILEIPCFYHHLRTECEASQERVVRIKKCFQVMQRSILDLLGSLRFCSPLGPLFRDLETAKAGVGLKTKEKLEALGLTTLSQIAKLTDSQCKQAGIRKDLARRLRTYATRRAL